MACLAEHTYVPSCKLSTALPLNSLVLNPSVVSSKPVASRSTFEPLSVHQTDSTGGLAQMSQRSSRASWSSTVTFSDPESCGASEGEIEALLHTSELYWFQPNGNSFAALHALIMKLSTKCEQTHLIYPLEGGCDKSIRVICLLWMPLIDILIIKIYKSREVCVINSGKQCWTESFQYKLKKRKGKKPPNLTCTNQYQLGWATLTCDIQGDGGSCWGIFAQVAGKRGAVVCLDDRRDAHAAASLSVSFFQADSSAIPQPDQIFILVWAINLTNQWHGLIQLCHDDAVAAGSRGRLDQDTFWNVQGRQDNVRGWQNKEVTAPPPKFFN